MRRIVLIALAATALVAVQGAAAEAVLPVRTPVSAQVTPRTGGPRTTFRLALRNPFAIGPTATLQRSETVDLRGPHRRACVWSGVVPVPAASAQQLLRVALNPSRLTGGGRATTWCTGVFHGSVFMTVRLPCTPPRLCPMLLIRPQLVARFSFQVTRRG